MIISPLVLIAVPARTSIFTAEPGNIHGQEGGIRSTDLEARPFYRHQERIKSEEERLKVDIAGFAFFVVLLG